MKYTHEVHALSVEVWDGARKVASFPPDKTDHP